MGTIADEGMRREREASATPGSAAFDDHAEAWDAYTETPLGRLRQALITHRLLEALAARPLGQRVLDVGGGTGGYALPLAQRGDSVCLLDISQRMLDLAERRAATMGQGAGKIGFRCLPAEGALAAYGPASFDVVLCHTTIEYVSRPLDVLGDLGRLVRPGGLLSLVLVNPAADALRWALAKGDLRRARRALRETTSEADLFGVPRHTVSVADAVTALVQSGRYTVAEYGVRVFADYLSRSVIEGKESYQALWELELAAGGMEPYRRIARYLHLLCGRES